MNKVYVVTKGEYSDYGIERIFSTREAAEKYCATDKDEYYSPMIEEWDLEDGSDIICPNVYKAICFRKDNHYAKFIDYEIKYSCTPFELDIQLNRKVKYGHISGLSGYIPINKTIKEAAVIQKIIYDAIAKWEAQQMDLKKG